MSLDTFIVVDPCTNKFFAACDAYLVNTRKLSGEEYNALFDYPSPKTQEILNKHGMSLDSCEYHKIMEDAEKEVEETVKIDLEKFIGKEVVITNNSDGIRKGTMTMSNHKRFPYQLYTEDDAYIHYNREGYNITDDASNPYNIKHIELKQPQQSQKPMTPLSNATIQKLADALTDDAIKYLETDEEVIETLVCVLNRFLTDRMGQMDETLLGELSVTIFENFDLVSNNK